MNPVSEVELQDCVSRIADAYKCSHDFVEVAYGRRDGEWGWTIRVAAQYRHHGRGRRLVRCESHSWAEDLSRAAQIACDKAWSYLDV